MPSTAYPSRDPGSNPLLTDLYQLTMLQTYYEEGMTDTAVFELFFRRLPRTRNFLVAAGLEQALEFLEHLHFLPEELDWLATQGTFQPGVRGALAHCASPATSTPCPRARSSSRTSRSCASWRRCPRRSSSKRAS